jgi:RNA polymerase sigma factor (sigma-70 family)
MAVKDAHVSSDAELDPAVLAAAAAGDQRAWAQVVHRYKRLIYSIPRKYRLPPETCDDVFQSVFAALIRELPRVRDPQALPKWIITTTHRECWRVSKSRRPAEAAEEQPIPEVLPLDHLERWERVQALEQALTDLGGRCESLLRLLFLRTTILPYEEAANLLGIPVGSIGPTRARCLAKLAELLGPGTE